MTRSSAFIYHNSLTKDIFREGHPLQPVRLRHTYELLEAYGAFSTDMSNVVGPRKATMEELLTFHAYEYIEVVEGLSRGKQIPNASKFGFSQLGDNPIFPGMYEASLLTTGASVLAAELVLSGQVDVAFNGSGGMHHAMASNASGFCIFNDPVIAINHLLSRKARVAYVDIDAHHGDGVQQAYYSTDKVLTISIHESGQFLFPGTGLVEEFGEGEGRGYSVNIPLAPYTGDETYLMAFREVVPPLIESFQPDVIVTQLGIDSYHTDPLTHLRVTSIGYVELVNWFCNLDLPWLALGGGGYDIDAVVRCWCLAYGVMSGNQWPNKLPDNYSCHSESKLRDVPLACLENSLEQNIESYAMKSVDEVKRLMFPTHGLG